MCVLGLPLLLNPGLKEIDNKLLLFTLLAGSYIGAQKPLGFVQGKVILFCRIWQRPPIDGNLKSLTRLQILNLQNYAL